MVKGRGTESKLRVDFCVQFFYGNMHTQPKMKFSIEKDICKYAHMRTQTHSVYNIYI